MKRKTFLKAAAAGGLAIPSLLQSCQGETQSANSKESPSPQKNKTFRWKMVTTWPPNFPVLGEGCNLFADWVEEMSDGRLLIKVYGGGELIPALEAFDAVSSGTAELGSGAAYYWAGKVPAAQFFATVPFGMNAQQRNAWLYGGDGLRLWQELYAKYNLVPFAGGNTGVQMGGWFNKEINSLEDLKGLKMRIPGLGGKVLEKAGGTAVLVAGGEIYTNLERGVIDATEWIGPYHDYKMGFHNIAKYCYYPGWHEPGSTLELFANKTKLEELPKDLQAILEAASARLNNWMLSEFEAQNAVFLKKMKEEGNVEFRPFPAEVLNQLRTYTEEVVAEITNSDPDSKKIYENYQAFREDLVQWSNLTEKEFYNNIQE